jgi:hypothetical protein
MEIDKLLDAFLLDTILPESHRAELYAVIGIKWVQRFEQTGSVDDLDQAITMFEQAIFIYCYNKNKVRSKVFKAKSRISASL